MTLAEQITNLGYTLVRGSVDDFGRKWKYTTFPNGAGSTNRFNGIEDVRQWVKQVEQIRKFNEEGQGA